MAAEIFLRLEAARTIAGTMLGLIASLALSTGLAFLIYIFIRLSGRDYASLKGAMTAVALGFITLGGVAPLLRIVPQIQGDLVTNYVALINLTALGIFQGYLVGRLMTAGERESR